MSKELCIMRNISQYVAMVEDIGTTSEITSLYGNIGSTNNRQCVFDTYVCNRLVA